MQTLACDLSPAPLQLLSLCGISLFILIDYIILDSVSSSDVEVYIIMLNLQPII